MFRSLARVILVGCLLWQARYAMAQPLPQVAEEPSPPEGQRRHLGMGMGKEHLKRLYERVGGISPAKIEVPERQASEVRLAPAEIQKAPERQAPERQGRTFPRAEFSVHGSKSNFGGEWGGSWVGIQVGRYLTKHFGLMGGIDVLVSGQPLCDQLLEGNGVYTLSEGPVALFALAGLGLHHCFESNATTPMVNMGAGLRTNGRPAIKLEYKRHMKFSGGSRSNITEVNFGRISVGLSMLW